MQKSFFDGSGAIAPPPFLVVGPLNFFVYSPLNRIGQRVSSIHFLIPVEAIDDSFSWIRKVSLNIISLLKICFIFNLCFQRTVALNHPDRLGAQQGK